MAERRSSGTRSPKRKAPVAKVEDLKEDRCIACGYCKHCGQSRQQYYPYFQYPTYFYSAKTTPWPGNGITYTVVNGNFGANGAPTTFHLTA